MAQLSRIAQILAGASCLRKSAKLHHHSSATYFWILLGIPAFGMVLGCNERRQTAEHALARDQAEAAKGAADVSQLPVMNMTEVATLVQAAQKAAIDDTLQSLSETVRRPPHDFRDPQTSELVRIFEAHEVNEWPSVTQGDFAPLAPFLLLEIRLPGDVPTADLRTHDLKYRVLTIRNWNAEFARMKDEWRARDIEIVNLPPADFRDPETGELVVVFLADDINTWLKDALPHVRRLTKGEVLEMRLVAGAPHPPQAHHRKSRILTIQKWNMEFARMEASRQAQSRERAK